MHEFPPPASRRTCYAKTILISSTKESFNKNSIDYIEIIDVIVRTKVVRDDFSPVARIMRLVFVPQLGTHGPYFA